MKRLFLLLVLMNACQANNDFIFINGFEVNTCVQGTVLFQENFNAVNQTPWDGFNQWNISGDGVAFAEINNNQAQLIPLSSMTPYSLARMQHPLNVINAQATFSIYFENAITQGIGFYLRSNGGFLDHTNPTGQGYGVFIEKFVGQQAGIGLWYEHDGIETSFVRDYDPSYQINDETEYRVRFQVFQETTTTTRTQARFWQAGTTEPNIWQVSISDNYVPLQNKAGGIVVDSYNTQSAGMIATAIRIDSIEVQQLCPML